MVHAPYETSLWNLWKKFIVYIYKICVIINIVVRRCTQVAEEDGLLNR